MLYLHKQTNKQTKKHNHQGFMKYLWKKQKKIPLGYLLQTIPPKLDESGNGERKDIPPYFLACAKFIISKANKREVRTLSLSLSICDE